MLVHNSTAFVCVVFAGLLLQFALQATALTEITSKMLLGPSAGKDSGLMLAQCLKCWPVSLISIYIMTRRQIFFFFIYTSAINKSERKLSMD